MGDKSAIEWTDATWNPTRGCTRVSPGCANCYAERVAVRYGGAGMPFDGLVRSTPDGPRWTGKVALVEWALDLPLRWRRPRRIFVDSMSDLFHGTIPDEYVARVFDVMRRAPQHTFQVLTKRAERMAEFTRTHAVPANAWIGVSVESGDYLSRVDDLRNAAVGTRFLSCEPLLGPLTELNLDGIAWVIVGGESGPRARPMDPDWARLVRNRCNERGIPFFFKQWGGRTPTSGGRVLDGRTWDEMPALAVAA